MAEAFQPLISLTTDFGLADGYVAAMKGVILGILPTACIVDISHEITPFNVYEGAYVLDSAVPYFPDNAVHVVVIDPGVGSTRHPIAVKTNHGLLVGPDNGVLAPLMEHLQVQQLVRLDNPDYWLSPVSETFHGRDIFAPVGAYLARGVPFSSIGTQQETWQPLPGWKPQRREGEIIGMVLHIDRFGNIITNIPASAVTDARHTISVRVGGQVLHGVQNYYGNVHPGEPLALIGSQGTVEISIREGNAAAAWDVHVGNQVGVDFHTATMGKQATD